MIALKNCSMGINNENRNHSLTCFQDNFLQLFSDPLVEIGGGVAVIWENVALDGGRLPGDVAFIQVF